MSKDLTSCQMLALTCIRHPVHEYGMTKFASKKGRWECLKTAGLGIFLLGYALVDCVSRIINLCKKCFGKRQNDATCCKVLDGCGLVVLSPLAATSLMLRGLFGAAIHPAILLTPTDSARQIENKHREQRVRRNSFSQPQPSPQRNDSYDYVPRKTYN